MGERDKSERKKLFVCLIFIGLSYSTRVMADGVLLGDLTL